MKNATVIFTGPTLSAEAASVMLPDAIVLPPARQGDLWRAVREHRAAVVVLIDGLFLHEPAIWHREILWALSEGIHVFGGASMGALRAAELAPFGMRGVGRVFEAYCDGVWPGYDGTFEDDDEVAVIHAPIEMGASALSDALVDLRDTLLAAEEAKVIDGAARSDLFDALRALHYPQRSLDRLLTVADKLLAPDVAAVLRAWLPTGAVARKRLDARALLEEVAAFLSNDPSPFEADFHFEDVDTWRAFVAEDESALTSDEALVLQELRLRPREWHNVAAAALGRLQARAAATPQSDQALRRAFANFRLANGLVRQTDVDRWLVDNALQADGLERLLSDELAIAASLRDPSPAFSIALADHLRLAGRFVPLLQRAREKQAMLGDISRPKPGPALDAALTWWAELHRGNEVAADDAFQTVIWREYIFVHRG